MRTIVQPAIWFNIVVLGLLTYFLGLRLGLVIAAAVAAHSTMSVLFRSQRTAVVTVLADGGIEVVRRYPVGGKTERIADDDLESVSRDGTVNTDLERWIQGLCEIHTDLLRTV